MRRLCKALTGLGLALTAMLASAAGAPAHAGTCAGVPTTGKCVDAHTVKWCSDGAVVTATCPDGEICAKHEEAFGGGYGCIDKALTDCAGLPPEGECTSGNNVVWCTERGERAVQTCGEGETCGWDPDNAWYDCVPASAGSSNPQFGPPADAGASAPDAGDTGDAGPSAPDADEADTQGDPAPDAGDPAPDAGEEVRGPTPSVEQGGVVDTPTRAATTDDGCAAGPGAATGLPLLAALAVLLRRRGA